MRPALNAAKPEQFPGVKTDDGLGSLRQVMRDRMISTKVTVIAPPIRVAI